MPYRGRCWTLGDAARLECKQLLAERAEGYGRFIAVDTEARSPEEVAEAVMEALGLAAN